MSLLRGYFTKEIVCNSCLLLQNEVSQRQAETPVIPASGSDTSLKLQSVVGNRGLSIGPKTTDFGKHSRKTAVSPSLFLYVYKRQASLVPQVCTWPGFDGLNSVQFPTWLSNEPHEKHFNGPPEEEGGGLRIGFVGLFGLVVGLVLLICSGIWKMAKIEKSYLIDGKSKEFVYTAHSVEKFTLTEKKFRQINHLVILFVKPLLSRKFWRMKKLQNCCFCYFRGSDICCIGNFQPSKSAKMHKN